MMSRGIYYPVNNCVKRKVITRDKMCQNKILFSDNCDNVTCDVISSNRKRIKIATTVSCSLSNSVGFELR